MTTFIQLAVLGEVESDEIEDFVDIWHDSSQESATLASFLGMSDDEYAAWVLNPDVLAHIISAHRFNTDFRSSLQSIDERRLAARSENPDKLLSIQAWLSKNT